MRIFQLLLLSVCITNLFANEIYYSNGNYISLNVAIKAIGTEKNTLVIDKEAVLDTTTLTIPENVALRFTRGGMITIASDQQLILDNVSIEAGLYQIFDYSIDNIKVLQGKINSQYLYPEWWGANGNDKLPDHEAFQKALGYTFYQYSDYDYNYGLSGRTVFISPGRYILHKPLEIYASVSMIGAGVNSILEPDFRQWEASDDKIALKVHAFTDKGEGDIDNHSANQNYGLKTVKQTLKDFRIEAEKEIMAIEEAINTEKYSYLLNTTAISIQDYESNEAAPSHALLYATIKNLYISDFETAIEIAEARECNFSDITISKCRLGISINGWVINSYFSNINIMNSRSNDNAATIGVLIRGNNYLKNGVMTYEEPEGLYFSNFTLYNMNYGIMILDALYINISNSMIDAISHDGIYISGNSLLNKVLINNNYIALSQATGSSAIRLAAISDSNESKHKSITITGNELRYYSANGLLNNCFGIRAEAGGQRLPLKIVGNNFENFHHGMYLNNVGDAHILNNTAVNLGSPFIYVGPQNQNYPRSVIVKNNILTNSTSSNPPIHPGSIQGSNIIYEDNF